MGIEWLGTPSSGNGRSNAGKGVGVRGVVEESMPLGDLCFLQITKRRMPMTITKHDTIAPIIPAQGVLELDLVEGMSVVTTKADEESGIDEVGLVEVERENKEVPEDESDEVLEAEDFERDTYELET